MSDSPQAAGGDNLRQADVRFLVEKNADGIIVLDSNGAVLFANPAAQELFGRRYKTLIGSSLGLPAIAGETTEIAVHRPGWEKLDVELRAVDTVWDGRPALLVSLRDISARRAMEEQLRHAAKMEAVGRLTAGIAHDFNNLLTIIMGNIEIAKRQSRSSTSPLGSALDNAMKGAKRAATLTERLLAFARRKPLEPHPFDPNALVTGMSELLQRTLGEAVTVKTVLARDLWPVEADPTELEAAILNLAVNARDAMPSGGNLVIETMNAELDKAYAAANSDLTPGSYVSISVSDTGIGMAADILAQAFEPFFTTKARGQGTGLGLSQVYGFAKQSAGHVNIYSEPGIGTTVRIYLPRLTRSFEAVDLRALRADERVIPHRGNGQAILIVEDDDDVRDYTARSVEEFGYRVITARDGPSALKIMADEPDLRLLITDLGLPGGIDGRALAEHARQRESKLPVLLMTAYAAAALVHDGRLDAGIELLPKPFTAASLSERVYDVLHRNLS